MEKKRILVSGATGQQGGSVVNALLGDGHEIVGITRNVDSPKAMALKERGVEMISVNFTDYSAAVEAMKGFDVVFALTTPFEEGLEKEVEQGVTMANAAVEAGVGHFIFNSVSDADQSTGVPHFDSKYEVEKHLKGLNLNWTVVGPTYFMDNMMVFNMDGLKEGKLMMAMPGDIPLQQVAVEDIGEVVAQVVNAGAGMYGQRINIAGDAITGEEMARMLTNAIGREITYQGFPTDVIREQSEDLALMYEWFISTGYSADMDLMRQRGMKSFEAWVNEQDWSDVKQEVTA